MHPKSGAIAPLLMQVSLLLSGCAGNPSPAAVSRGPELPDPVGFAGMAAGLSGRTLLAAGGANFPGKKPWEGGVKHFGRTVYAHAAGAWRVAGELDRPLAYAAYASSEAGLVLAGGTDDREHFRGVWRLAPGPDGLRTEALPELPQPTAYAACAVLGGRLFVIGGTDSPAATVASRRVWSLDLASPAQGWRDEPELPGAGRMLAVAGVCDGRLYVFGGCALAPGADGKPRREYLREALCLDAGSRLWRRVRDLPSPRVACPGPAPELGGALLLIGGDTGEFLASGRPPAEHPGQPKSLLAYRVAADDYAPAGESPVGVVTAPVVRVGDAWWVISGETAPGVRTNAVTVVEPK